MGSNSQQPIYMINSDITQDFRDCKASIDLTKKQDKLPLSNWMLTYPFRGYVINKIKAPLMKVLIMVASRLPEVTKENTTYEGTHVLMDICDKFFSYTSTREPMFRAAFKILLAEVEHDIFYRDVLHLFIEEIIKAILAGKWPARRDEEPMSYYWSNKTPKGGKYSITSILQNKKEMENLLGDKWILKECV